MEQVYVMHMFVWGAYFRPVTGRTSVGYMSCEQDEFLTAVVASPVWGFNTHA